MGKNRIPVEDEFGNIILGAQAFLKWNDINKFLNNHWLMLIAFMRSPEADNLTGKDREEILCQYYDLRTFLRLLKKTNIHKTGTLDIRLKKRGE